MRIAILIPALLLSGCALCEENQRACAVGAVVVGVAAGALISQSNHQQQKAPLQCSSTGDRVHCL